MTSGHPAQHQADIRQQVFSTFCIGITLILLSIAYLPGLKSSLLLDDFPVISPLLSLDVNQSLTESNRILSTSGALGRPVSMFTFILNGIAHGNDLSDWKRINVLLHLLNGLLLYLLSIRLISLTGNKRVSPWLAALLPAGIWMLHPLHVSTVLYTVQRMTELASLFTIMGLLMYISGRERLASGNNKGWIYLLATFLAALPLALFSKENGALLPVYTLLVEILVYRFRGSGNTRKQLLALYIVILAIPLLIVLYWMISSGYLLSGYDKRHFTLAERILTESRIVAHYMYWILIPVQNKMGFFHDDIPLSHSLTDPVSTLLTLIFHAGMMLMAWRVRTRLPLLSLGIFFFYIGHSIESTIYPLELAFEHRNYLPSWGLLLPLAYLPGLVGNSNIVRYLLITVSLATISILLSLRVSTWSEPGRMYTYMYRSHPASPRLNILLANNLAASGKYRMAVRLLRRFHGAGYTLNILHIKCLATGRVNRSLANRAGLEFGKYIDNYSMSGLIKTANLILDKRCSDPLSVFTRLINRALEKHFNSPSDRFKLLLYKAQLLQAGGLIHQAIEPLELAHRIQPDAISPFLLAAKILAQSNDIISATRFLERARSIHRKHPTLQGQRLIAETEKLIKSRIP